MDSYRKIELLIVRLASDLRNRTGLVAAARSIGIEPSYFSRRFQDVAGMTFSAWNRTIRIEAAKLLLEESGPSISRIAARLGYRDLTTFERNFRALAGVSPKQYQLRHRRQAPEEARARNAEKTRQAPKKTQGTPRFSVVSSAKLASQ